MVIVELAVSVALVVIQVVEKVGTLVSADIVVHLGLWSLVDIVELAGIRDIVVKVDSVG